MCLQASGWTLRFDAEGALAAPVPASGEGAAATGSEPMLRVFSSRPLLSGEPVEIDYGGRPNAELLTTHGFALQGGAHEALGLELAPEEGDRLGALPPDGR